MRSSHLIWMFMRALIVRRANLVMENLALRHQLAILNRNTARPGVNRFIRISLRP